MADMDINKLPNFVLVLIAIGLVVGIGIVVLANFGDSLRVSTSITEENVTIAENVTTGALSITSNVTAVTLRNGTTALTSAQFNFTSTGGITVSQTPLNFTNLTLNGTYTYLATTRGNAEIDNTVIAISAIPNTWLSLIVTVAILAIILVMVVRSFGQFQRR